MVRDVRDRTRRTALRDDIAQYWDELAGMATRMPSAALASVAEALLVCRALDRTVFLVGNGGSAATASHLACDLAKGTRVAGVKPFRVVSLTDNLPLLTAWANDASYDRVFAEQLAPLVREGDVLLVISASGNSPNALAAVEVARAAGATAIALTGETGGRVGELADLTVRVPVGPIELVEDAHLAIAHSLCVALRERLRSEAADAGSLPVVADRLVLPTPLTEPVAIDLTA